jgi:SET domain-containing protein
MVDLRLAKTAGFGLLRFIAMPKSRRTSATRVLPLGQPNSLIRTDRSSVHGQGVYARVTIPDGTRIVEYRGERITKVESERREAKRLVRLARGGDGCVYIFHLNRRHDLDGRTRGNVARFINHSCAPNCRAETIGGKIWIIARREIPAGTELSFDYGYAFKEWPQHPCRCQARGCAGYIVNAAQRWLVRRALREARRRAKAQRK